MKRNTLDWTPAIDNALNIDCKNIVIDSFFEADTVY